MTEETVESLLSEGRIWKTSDIGEANDMRKIEDFSNDHRGVEAKKVVLEIRKINSSICGFEGM